ncbi:hypothetical protein SADUNF_Sadunf07G0102100 [Salix dunnii]|uniref:TF-B3 domain-containing protein n=1 Tax=Salix dunnii TaxID=1413687 RepID=A0A835N2G3_9ROSI|nr:hypothetical protein SADUNF_Sadunf07G0102100 [Salix dunnii]
MGSILYSSGAPVLSAGNSQYSLISLEGSNFAANGRIFLSDVPENITLTPSLYTGKSISSGSGSFVGFDSKESKDRHVVPIGKLRNIKFMGIFRFKVWWTAHWVGSNGRDLEHETQMVMLDKSDDSGRPYVLLLPLLEGPFRASFQPGDDDNVDVCVERGHGGGEDASGYLQASGGENSSRYSGYPQGIWEGVKGLVEGGCPPGLVLISDGWQSISHDEYPITEEGMNAAVAGEQMHCRLLRFQENLKEEFTSAEPEVVKKGLTTSDIDSCLAYPTALTRNHGPHKKPVIRGQWLKYVREKGLRVDDFIILTKVEDAENGVSYNIRVEPNLELAL